MTAELKVTPNPAAPGQVVDVDVIGLDPKLKASFTTVDDACNEVGITTNVNRPRRSGAMYVGIKAPPLRGSYRVRVYQAGKIAADFLGVVQ